MSYVKDKNLFISSTRVKILEITSKLIQKVLVYPISPEAEKFTETTRFYNYRALSAGEQ